MTSTPITVARARVMALSRYHGPDSEQVKRARADLEAAKIEVYVQRMIEEAPPLSDAQRARLAALILGAGPASDGDS